LSLKAGTLLVRAAASYPAFRRGGRPCITSCCTASKTSFTSAQNQRMTGSFIRKAEAVIVLLKRTSEKERVPYRIIYLTTIGDVVHVLHAFQKKTQATAKRDIDLAKARLRQIR
jgi:hypothetical protein